MVDPRRWSIRGLMLAVAVTAGGLAVYTSRSYGGRRAYYLDRARVFAGRREEFAAKAVEARLKAQAFLKVAEGVEGEPREKNLRWAEDEMLRERLFRRVAEYDARQERRFLEAADHPWAGEPRPEAGPDAPPVSPY